MKSAAIIAGIVLSVIAASDAAAHSFDEKECAEGSSFIRNAALARENGMDGLTFIAKMLADFLSIRSFPIELRWLVQDLQDEDFLIKAASEVFVNPQAPDVHQRTFLELCLGQTSPNPVEERVILKTINEAPE